MHGADTPLIHVLRRKNLNAGADDIRKRGNQYLRNLTRMQKNEDCDEIGMGQLRALSPWMSRGHQRMMQTRSMTNIAEERGWRKQGGSLHGHLRAVGSRTMMMMMMLMMEKRRRY